jgi:hypothetical protein
LLSQESERVWGGGEGEGGMVVVAPSVRARHSNVEDASSSLSFNTCKKKFNLLEVATSIV